MGNNWLQTGIIVLCALLVINIVGLIGLQLDYTPKETSTASDSAVDLLLVVNSDCTDCFDASQYEPELTTLGVEFGAVETVEFDSSAGKKAVKKYDLTRIPALVMSDELAQYETISGAWSRIGTVAKDGSYILQGSPPPFYDLEEERVRGLVSVIYLDDASCEACYDPQVHKQILARLGMGFEEERVVDIASEEGQGLLSQYDITAVPTILLRGEASLYPSFDGLWQSVGRSDEDGTYVFTNLPALEQPYKDLSSGLVMGAS